MAKRKNYRPLTTLMALAAAALVAATMTFTNVTYWLINATMPPAMAYPGADTTVGDGQYVKVDYYYDSTRHINITRISILGFVGNPVNYSSVIRVCNYYGSGPIEARLHWVGPVTTTGHEGYIKAFLVKGPDGQGVGFVDSTTYSTAGPYTISPGGCLEIGAYVVIDPNTPRSLADGRTVLGQYQVEIRMSPT